MKHTLADSISTGRPEMFFDPDSYKKIVLAHSPQFRFCTGMDVFMGYSIGRLGAGFIFDFIGGRPVTANVFLGFFDLDGPYIFIGPSLVLFHLSCVKKYLRSYGYATIFCLGQIKNYGGLTDTTELTRH